MDVNNKIALHKVDVISLKNNILNIKIVFRDTRMGKIWIMQRMNHVLPVTYSKLIMLISNLFILSFIMIFHVSVNQKLS